MISPDEARQVIFQNIAPLNSEIVSHENALNRVLARDVFATLDLPPFDNSAVDGYALRFEDLQNVPRDFAVCATIAAAKTDIEYSIEANQAARIMTGAPIPRGANCVVMREDTVENTGKKPVENARGNAADVSDNATENLGDNAETVRVLEAVKSGANIRRRGSDVRSGERVLDIGTRIRAAQWAMLASLGCAQVEVFRRPRVGILITGSELKRVDESLQNGEIRDSNSFALRALVEDCGAIVTSQKTVGDDVKEVENALRAMFQSCDAVVTSGGVSMGDFDPIRDVLPQIAQLHFWKIAVKPGKPVMFATREENGRTIPVWGLPGNPVSVMVSFEQFVREALMKMGGQIDTQRLQMRVRVLDAFSSPLGKVEYVRAFVTLENNAWKARVHGDQGSGRLSTMTRANALLVVAENVTRVESGDELIAEIVN